MTLIWTNQSQSTTEDFDSQVSNWSDSLSKPSIESLNEALQILRKGSISPFEEPSKNSNRGGKQQNTAKKTNLRGLDNIAADGNTSFDLLINVTRELLDKEVLDRDNSDEILSKLKKNDRCADHCITWALSDTKEKEYAADCNHLYDLVCYRCNLLPDVMQILVDRVNNTSGK
ncbi:unnamed protein product [Mytilus coruscus]|uniref:Uncharacterized protein n=1 Tax=Mytilus coruscus TaxID=42192 RepID=A0A6J8EF14_MYTCO|nr:unnamed protein product [Mytilus coruscus]